MSRPRPRTLLVTGGTVVSSAGQSALDVLVEDGSIAAVGVPGSLAGARVLDADGLLVLPGLVDAHVHVRDPGLTHKEDFLSASRAAAVGGITTILVMPYDDPLTEDAALLADKARHAEGRSVVDFGLQAVIGERNVDRVDELAAAGAVSLEIELADAPDGLAVEDAETLRRILVRSRAAGVPVGAYCQDDSIMAARRQELRAAGSGGVAAHIASEPPLGELLAAQMICAVAQDTGAAVHLRQISTPAALDAACRARAAGADVTVEVTPHNLLLTEDDAIAAGGVLKVSPPLRSADAVEALRSGVRTGRVDLVATDHAPHAPDEKAIGELDIWAAPGGLPGLETLLSAMLEICGEDQLGTLVRCCCERPAERFGLAHRKGRVTPGHDADLVLVDLRATWRVEPRALHTRAGSSPFAGRRLRGRAECTIVGGEVVAERGVIVGEPAGAWARPLWSRPR